MKHLSWIISEFRWLYGIMLLGLIYIIILQFSRDIIQIALLAVALIPGMLYIGFVRLSDVGRKEPVGVVALHVMVGILLIYPALFLERFGVALLQIVGISPSNVSILFWVLYGLLIIAPVEEGLKYLGFFLAEYIHSENDEPTDSVVYMVALGGGFALFENYRYILGTSGISIDEALTAGIARSFTAIPIHLGLGLVMGYYLSLYRFPIQLEQEEIQISGNRWKALIIPLVLHGFYDVLVFIVPSFVVTLVLAVLFAMGLSYYAWRKVIRIRKLEKQMQ